MALKYMAGAMPSTPYTALNYLTRTPHITDYLKGEAAKGADRLMGRLDPGDIRQRYYQGTHHPRTNSFIPLTLTNMTADITKPKLPQRAQLHYHQSNSHSQDCKNRLNSDIIEASTHGICCFTDGSKTEHGTGGGFVIYATLETITEHSFKMKDYCTVFQAETAAIKHAAEELITFNNQQITFWSDSLYLHFRLSPIKYTTTNPSMTAIKLSPNLQTKTQYNLNG